MTSTTSSTSRTARDESNPNGNNDHNNQDVNRLGDQDEDDDVVEEVPRIFDEDGTETHTKTSAYAFDSDEPGSTPHAEDRPKTPAYVAPIPKIGPIPPISSSASASASRSEPPPATIPVSSSTTRPQLPPAVGAFLVGKRVDEYGDIVDAATGQVFARAGGDLPSLVGRAVSNPAGDILGDEGELLGWVEDVELGKRKASGAQDALKPRSLVDLLGRSTAALMVDHVGNILDAQGNVVGKFHDNNNPLHKKEREEREAIEREARERDNGGTGRSGEKAEEPRSGGRNHDRAGQETEREPGPDARDENQTQSRPRRTESERRRNAESWRKENPGESPSDIFLDVKSTTEGIQLTIRIPTVFGNGQQVRPNISFS